MVMRRVLMSSSSSCIWWFISHHCVFDYGEFSRLQNLLIAAAPGGLF